MRNLFPFISPLLLLLSFWQILINPEGIFWFCAVGLVLIWLTGRALTKRHFWQFIRLWINLSLVYLVEVLFTIILISNPVKYWLVLAWTLIWFIVFWLLRNYFAKLKNINDADYLSFNRFLYYLGFWLLSTSLISLITFINFSLWYSLIILLVVTYAWTRELLWLAEEEISPYFIWLVLLMTGQIFLASYLLPLSFLATGTIISLWYFFIVDFTISREKKFKKYLLFFVAAMFIILISSLFKY